MKKIVLTFLACLALCAGLRAQGLAWAFSSSESFLLQPTAIEVDAEGNLLIIGDFAYRDSIEDNLQADLDPGPGQYLVPFTSALYGFFLKMDPHGKLLRAETYSSPNNVTFLDDVIAAQDGGYFITGRRYGFARPSFPDAVPEKSGVFLHRHRQDGSLVWKKEWLCDCQIYEESIVEDNEDNVELVLHFFGLPHLEPGTEPSVSETSGEIARHQGRLGLVRLDANGNDLGGKEIQSTINGRPWASILSGSALYQLVLKSDKDAQGQATADEGFHLLRYDLNGGPVLHHHFEKGGYIPTRSLVPDGQGGIWLAEGRDLKERPLEAIDLEDEHASWKLFHFGPDMIPTVKGHLGNKHALSILEMATDRNGDLYLTGRKMGPADLDPGHGVQEFGSLPDASDMFVLRLDPDANLRWASMLEAFPDEVRKELRVSRNLLGSLVVSEAGQVYILGVMDQSIDFDPGPGSLMMPPRGQAKNGDWNFILSLNKCDAAPHQAANAIGSYYWPISGQTYAKSGRYKAPASTTDDCGAATLDLEILPSAPSESPVPDSWTTAPGSEGNAKVAKTRIHLYPNPTKGRSTLELGRPSDVVVTLTDVSGRVLMRQAHKEIQELAIDLPVAKGIYFLQVSGPGISKVIQISKE